MKMARLYEAEEQKREVSWQVTVEGTPFKHETAEIHGISHEQLSKIEAAHGPMDAAGDE
jgi:hypothetical protein